MTGLNDECDSISKALGDYQYYEDNEALFPKNITEELEIRIDVEHSNIYLNLQQNYANVCTFDIDKIKASILNK